MTASETTLASIPIDPDELASDYLRRCAILARHEAGEAVRYLAAGRDPNGFEWVALDIDAGLGTGDTVRPIRPVERIRLYANGPEMPPFVVPMRDDFPDVPHLNPARAGQRRSLCLYDEPWEEVRLSWTPSEFLERIRTWLVKTAYGELQAADQPLDPMILGSALELVVPVAWLQGEMPPQVRLAPFRAAFDSWQVLQLVAGHSEAVDEALQFVLVTIDGGIREHGTLRLPPRNLSELLALDPTLGSAVRSSLHEKALDAAGDEGQPLLGRNVLLLLTIGLRRDPAGPVERRTLHGFVTAHTLGNIAAAFGWLASTGDASGAWGALIGSGLDLPIEEIALDTCSIHPALSRERAAETAGRSPNTRALALVGAGALGSQLARTLAQEGYGRWTIIDSDWLLPHNLARHALEPLWLGAPKAQAMSASIRALLGDNDSAHPVVRRVSPNEEFVPELHEALESAELILDASASVAAARRLLHGGPAGCPMMSLFFNPNGTDLVVLCDRAIGAADAGVSEACYYRALCLDEDLATHLDPPASGVLSNLSCREPSAQIPQSRIMRLVGRASDAVREHTKNAGSSVTLWQDDPEGQRRRVHRTGLAGYAGIVDGWRIVAPEDLIDDLKAHRERATSLPSGSIETCGVVCGVWDMVARTVLLVLVLGPPSDSERAVDGCRRGHAGLERKVEAVRARTRRMVSYVGEWHTHPAGHSSWPSSTDRRFIEETSRTMTLDGLPALMLIVGDDGVRAVLKAPDSGRESSVLLRRATGLGTPNRSRPVTPLRAVSACDGG